MAQNSVRTVKRGPGRPFEKGQSGNPGGRKRLPPEFVEGCFDYTLERGLAKLIEHAECMDRSISLRALELIAAYGLGRPKERIETSQDRPTLIEVDLRVQGDK